MTGRLFLDRKDPGRSGRRKRVRKWCVGFMAHVSMTEKWDESREDKFDVKYHVGRCDKTCSKGPAMPAHARALVDYFVNVRFVEKKVTYHDKDIPTTITCWCVNERQHVTREEGTSLRDPDVEPDVRYDKLRTSTCNRSCGIYEMIPMAVEDKLEQRLKEHAEAA
jgi:hypothetical protein